MFVLSDSHVGSNFTNFVGDLIGVKTLSSDPLHVDNFMTDYDEEGKAKQKGAEEDKRRKRQVRRIFDRYLS